MTSAPASLFSPFSVAPSLETLETQKQKCKTSPTPHPRSSLRPSRTAQGRSESRSSTRGAGGE